MHELSCIVTVYNKMQCLEQLIYSLKSQNGDIDTEYIFVDDGSTDGSLEALKNLCKNLPNSIILTKENQGPSSAVNMGLKYATKKWVYLGDGDDYICQDGFITLLDLTQKYDAKVYRGVHCNDPNSSKVRLNKAVRVYDDAMGRVLSGLPMNFCIIDRELMLKIGGCDERVFVQDYSIALRVSRYTKIVIINKLIAYNINLGQERLSSKKIQENYDAAAARYLFITENPDIDYKYKYIAIKRQMSKSWSWFRKNTAAPKIWSKYFIRYVVSRFDFGFSEEVIARWMRESLDVYDKSKIRYGAATNNILKKM